MAASEESCDGNPNFAVICSFIAKFGDDCGVSVTIPYLQQMLEDTKNVNEDLKELHIHLLRRGRKRVNKERWEKSLIKFCHEYSSVDAWELERFGYKKAKLSVKLELLKRLLELQFDSNAKFKGEVNKQDAQSLRILPIGRDIDGNMYWYQLDKEHNMRLYRQEVGEENVWQLLCSTKEGLKDLVTSLEKKSGKFKEDDDLSKDEPLESKTLPEVMDITVPKKENEDFKACISETKPCTIIIKTEKKDSPSNHSSNTIKLSDNSSHLDTPVKNCVSETVLNKNEVDMEVELQEVCTKTDLKPVEKISSLSNSDNCIKSELSPDKKNESVPMEIDSEPKTDIETNSSESVVKVDNKLLSSSLITHEKIQAEPNKSLCNNTVTPVVESLDQESKFKVGKIKLYEKWSNEKKKLAAAQSECNLVSSDSLPSNKEHVDPERSVAMNPEVDVLCSVSEKPNLLKHSDGFPSNIEQSVCNDEVPMDLSVSCRTSDGIKQSASVTNTHSVTVPLPTDSKNSLLPDSKRSDSLRNAHSESAGEHPFSDKCSNVENSSMNINPQVPRPFKKKHLSMVKDDSVKGNYEHARKSVIFEVKNSKLLNQYGDIPYNHDDRPSQVSGFSHLQALQNMCDNNPMAGLQNSVIQSVTHDKKSKLDSNSCKNINSNEKPSFSGTCFDNLSKYNFSGAQVSTDIKSAIECEVTDTLLKSNVNCSPVSSQKDKHEINVPELNCEATCTKSETTNHNCETSAKSKIDMLNQKEENSVKMDIKSNSECFENVPKIPVKAVDATECMKKPSEESIKTKKIEFTVLDADASTHSVVQNDKSCNNVEVTSDGKEKELVRPFDKNATQVKVSALKITENNIVKAESSVNTENSVGSCDKQQEKNYLVTGRKEEQEAKPVGSSEQSSKKIKTNEEAEECLKSSDIREQSDGIIIDKQLISSEEVLENKNVSVSKDEIKVCVVNSDNNIVRNDFAIKKSSDESDKCASTKSQQKADSSVSLSSAVSVETGIKSSENKSKCSEINLHCSESEVSSSNLVCQDSVKNGVSESRNINSSDRDSEKCTEEVSLKNEKALNVSINSKSKTVDISLNDVAEEKKEACKDLKSLSKVSDLSCISVEKQESAAVTSEHTSVLSEKNSVLLSMGTSDISENNVLVNVANEKLSSKATNESSKSECDSANAEKNKSLPKDNDVLADSNSDMPSKSMNMCEIISNNSESYIQNENDCKSNKEIDVSFKNNHIKPAVAEDIDSSKKESQLTVLKKSCAEDKIEKELESKTNEGSADCVVSDGQLSKKCELPNASKKITTHESKIQSASKKDSFQANIKENSKNDTCPGMKENDVSSDLDSKSKVLKNVSDLTDAVENGTVVSDHAKLVSELDNVNEKSTSGIHSEVKENSAPVTSDLDDVQTDVKNSLSKCEEVMENKSVLLKADNKMNGDENNSSESGVKCLSTSVCKEKLSDTEEISEVKEDKTTSVQSSEKHFKEVNKIKKVSKKGSGKSNKKGVKNKSKKVASDQKLENNSDGNKSLINSNSEQSHTNDLEKSCKNLVVSIVDAKICGMTDMPVLKEPCLDETDKKVPVDKDISEDLSVKCNDSIKVERKSENEMPELSVSINRISTELSTPVTESKRKCRKPRRRARWDVRRSRKKTSKTACKDKPVSISKEVIIENSNESVLEIPSCDTKSKSKGSKSSLEENKASVDATVLELDENASFEKEEDISLAVIKESLKSPRNSESKCNLKVPNLRISVKDMYDIYVVMKNICLETKFKHPSCSNSASIVSNESNLYVKSDQISGLSIDTVNDDVIPIDISSASPVKKKKGRLRPKAPAPKPKESKVPVLKSSVKTPAKSAKKRNVNNSKKLSDANDDQFSIPEGFLEILGNAENDLHSSNKEPARKSRRSADLSVISLQSSEGESTPRKRSRRIQEQHQKKISELAVEMEREQRMLEQLAKKSNVKKNVPQKTPEKTPVKAKESKKPVKTKPPPPVPEEICLDSKRATRKMNSRSRNMTKMTLMYEDESKDSEFSTSRDTDKSKKRRKGRGTRKGFRPWDVSSESSSSIEELTEEEEEEHEEPLVFEVNEDEFACEEVEEDAEPVVIRRARTAKKTSEGESEEPVVIDDKPCSKCGKYDRPEWILLCDKCDNGYHTSCLIPPLMLIPDGDWFCQPCEHMFLCECLQNELQKLETVLKQKEREELRKQRLAYVGISLDNVLKPEKKEKSDESSKEDGDDKNTETKRDRRKDSSDDERQRKLYGKRSVRARRNVNYQFKEYDELIASAIQEEMLGVKLAEEAFKEAEEGADDDNDSDKSFAAKIPKTKTRKRRSKKLNDLDFTDDDEDSGEEYKGLSTDSEHTPPPSSNESDQESGVSGEWRIVKTRGKSRRKVRRRRRGRDSSDEDWDEEGSDTYRPVTRRAAQKNISYRELSSDEGEEEWQEPKPKKTPKRRKAASSEESEASFKETKPKKKPKVRKWVSSDSESEKSMTSSEESESSQESEDQWKVNKSCEGNRIKLNINKKAISSEEDDESTSRESVPRKRVNKIVSDESEEEESSSEDDKQDSADDDDDENSSKQAVKDKCPAEKESAKEVSVKSVEPEKLLKRDVPNVLPREPIRETVTVVTVRDKAPLRTVKKEATKMVPCVIPYDKSPKSGHGTTPEEESDKEVPTEKESLPLAGKVPGPPNVSQPNHPISQTFSINKTPAVIQPTPERKPFTSTIMEPFSNIDEGDDSDDEVPLERIPTTCVPNPHPNKSAIYEREAEYTPAKELPGFSYTAPEEKCFPPSYTSLAPFQDYSSRPSPLKPSLVETYPSNSSPSKLTPLDTYSQNSSPKGFISLDSYSEARKKKHFYGNPSAEPEAIPRPVPPSVDSYQGEIRFPPEPYPCPPSPNTYSNRSPPHVQRDPGTPPRLYSQFPDAYAPPRSPEYYQNHQYYASEERIPRPSYQPNYAPPETVPPFISNPYVATPVPQPNGGFMIDTLLRARNPENEEDELTGVTDIVSYITQE